MSETFLFIDTETTGFPKKGSLIAQGQARVCQLAMLLTDNQGKSLMEFSSLICPDNWSISEGAAKVHGFTDDLCAEFGLDFRAAFSMYGKFAGLASMIVAHNSDFDKGMMDIEQEYYFEKLSLYPEAKEDHRIKTPWHCTMKTNTHITGGKWPKLEETLRHYCNRSLGDSAHDAMYDVKACKDIFFAVRKRNAA